MLSKQHIKVMKPALVLLSVGKFKAKIARKDNEIKSSKSMQIVERLTRFPPIDDATDGTGLVRLPTLIYSIGESM